MITKDIRYIGVNDKDLDLFEGQYAIPNGVSYNSYVILDDQVAVLDTVDKRKTEEFLANLERELQGRSVDYLVVNHLEPDHASSIRAFVDRYPKVRLVGNAKTFQMLPQYFELDLSQAVTVKEGDTLSLGHHELHFVMAPMVHWPEVMMTYDATDRVLFSADAFGKFGALDVDEPWTEEARRYYFNIVGKFGANVQSVLKKAAGLDIQMICPLHGPVLQETIPEVIGLYDLWSRYEPESEGVLIAYASLHGNTAQAAKMLAGMLEQAGTPTQLLDLARCDTSLALSEAFRYGKVVLAASSYNGGVIPWMDDFLHHLLAKNYQKRTVGLMENGSWGPSAVRTMKGVLAQMKELTIIEPAVTLRGAMKPGDVSALEALAKALMA